MDTVLKRAGRHVEGLRWEGLSSAVRALAPYILLDALGCGMVGNRLGVLRGFVDDLVAAGGPAQAVVWGHGARLPVAHAALANGSVAHHTELDDGDPRASLHGGVTVVPAALAVAEATGASGRALLEAIVAGYNAAIACGRPLKAGIEAHRLHTPSMVGCFGGAAAAARLLDLSAEAIASALALAGTLLPMGPFEAFTRGAAIKDLYGGWPAFVGVQAACLAANGMEGPLDLLEAERDGLGSFLVHGPGATIGVEPDSDELLYVYFKAYSACRSIHPTLTALERSGIRGLDPDEVESIVIETYPFAVDLTASADSSNPIGARTSVEYCAASMLLDGELYPEAFLPDALADPRRRALEKKVRVGLAADMVEPQVRGCRAEIHYRDGSVRGAETSLPRWDPAEPATPEELRAKFRRLASRAAPAVESAVDDLIEAPDLGNLVSALEVRP